MPLEDSRHSATTGTTSCNSIACTLIQRSCHNDIWNFRHNDKVLTQSSNWRKIGCWKILRMLWLFECQQIMDTNSCWASWANNLHSKFTLRRRMSATTVSCPNWMAVTLDTWRKIREFIFNAKRISRQGNGPPERLCAVHRYLKTAFGSYDQRQWSGPSGRETLQLYCRMKSSWKPSSFVIRIIPVLLK